MLCPLMRAQKLGINLPFTTPMRSAGLWLLSRRPSLLHFFFFLFESPVLKPESYLLQRALFFVRARKYGVQHQAKEHMGKIRGR